LIKKWRNESTISTNYDEKENMKGISIPLPMGKIISDITYKVPKIVPSVKGNNPWDSTENLKPERVEVLVENEKKRGKKYK